MSDWVKQTEEANRRQHALLKERLKRNGLFLLLFMAVTALLLKGMLLHAFWHPFGPVILIPTLYFFSATVSNAGMIVHGFLLEREFAKPQFSQNMEGYVAPKPRSGRRRPK